MRERDMHLCRVRACTVQHDSQRKEDVSSIHHGIAPGGRHERVGSG